MAENNETLRNVCSVVDAVDFIIKHQDKLTATEAKTIDDPLILSKTLFRRVLGQIFENFEIRKNSDHYSLRCTSENIYVMLYVYDILTNKLGGNLSKIDQALKDRLTAATAPMSNFFANFNDGIISYKFRNEQRFFLYVNFMPYTYRGRITDGENTFNAYNMASRIVKLQGMYDQIKDIVVDSVAPRFMQFFVKFGVYCLSNLPRTVSLTEELMDYALQSTQTGLYQVTLDFQRERQAQQEPRPTPRVRPVEVSPTAPFQDFIQRFTTTNIETPIEPSRRDNSNVAPTEDQNRFRSALARIRTIDEQNQQAEATANAPEVAQETVQAAANPGQQLFAEALARIRERDGDRFFNLDEEFLASLDNPLSIEDQTEQMTLNYHIDDDEYIRLMHKCKLEGMKGLFRTTSVEMYDDIDTDLHGLYFELVNGNLTYKVFEHNVLALETSDYDAAVIYCRERSGLPEEIKYLEEINNAYRN